MLKLNEDNERGITKEELDSFKDWDVQYIPEWALYYIMGYLDYNHTTELTPEDVKEIIKYEIKMTKNGFEPSDFNFIRWDSDMQGDGEYEYEIDPDPSPAFCWDPSFGYACNVYPVLYVKK